MSRDLNVFRYLVKTDEGIDSICVCSFSIASSFVRISLTTCLKESTVFSSSALNFSAML